MSLLLRLLLRQSRLMLPIPLPLLLLLLLPHPPHLGRSPQRSQPGSRRPPPQPPPTTPLLLKLPQPRPLRHLAFLNRPLPAPPLARRQRRRTLAPHTHPLHFAQSSETVRENDDGERRGYAAHAPEAQAGLFHEVFEVHAVEGCDEGARSEAEGEDGEAQFEEHERVAVSVEDGADAVVITLASAGVA